MKKDMTNEPVGMKRLYDLICETDAAYHEASVRLGIADSVMQILYTICREKSREAVRFRKSEKNRYQ